MKRYAKLILKMKLVTYYFSLFDFDPDEINNAETIYYVHNC